METCLKAFAAKGTRIAAFAVLCLFWAMQSMAQQPQSRISAEIDNSSCATISGSRPPRANSGADTGKMPSGTKLQGITLVFGRTEAQAAALQTLIAAQQDPTSPLYHQWLTPDQFGAMFGMADADLAKVEVWLQKQGFSVDSVSHSRDRITFSGTEGQVESAFGTELHFYKSGDQTNFAPASDISIPAALASSVLAVKNLSDYRPRSHVKFKNSGTAEPNFTLATADTHFLTPKDVATIYDINAAYNAGYTGTNQSIAIIGQSAVVLSDVANFQAAAGLTAKAPTLVLVPGSGTAAIRTGDEAESDLDLEYSGAIAKGANIFFVYVGNNSNYGAFDSITYAVDERIAPIVSSSYGECEVGLGSTGYASLNAVLAQAATQGQTVIAAAGDNGSTDCYDETTLTTAQRTTVSADFPASSQYVTGLGGTEFSAQAVASGNTTYWQAAGSSDVIGSALSYIPEQVWNDDSANVGATYALSSGGGGISVFTTRPSWQTGVTGITSGAYRLIPDISLDASPNNAGYLYCSSDTQATGLTGSCASGFHTAGGTAANTLTIAGGTSFAAPIFAGMLAIINQSRNSTGQGLINPTLYTLAGNAATYATAFHDITTGTNECAAGAAYCTTAGAAVYSATTGYDEASGLGSIDLYNLLTAWPASGTSVLPASTTTLSAASSSPTAGASDAVTITVAPASSSHTVTPTGTVSVTVDGAVVSSSLALSSGVATYTFSSSTAGSHVIVATYSGDATYAGSTSTLILTIGATTSPTGTFSLSATALTIADGGSGSSTVTVTPSNGYTGTVAWTVSSNVNISNACYSIANLAIPGTAAVSTTFTVYTSASACSSAAVITGGAAAKRRFVSSSPIASKQTPSRPARGSAPLEISLAALLAAGFLGCRSRRMRSLLAITLLGIVSFGLSGCGEGSSGSVVASTTAAKGSYTLTLTGSDTVSSGIAATTTFTLVID